MTNLQPVDVQPEVGSTTYINLSIAEGGELFENKHTGFSLAMQLREDVLARGVENLKDYTFNLVARGGSHLPGDYPVVVASKLTVNVEQEGDRYVITMVGNEASLSSKSGFGTRSLEGCRDYVLSNLGIFAKGFADLVDQAVEKINNAILIEKELNK